jgi:hypothetical protein
MHTMERAAFFASGRVKKLQGLILNVSGALGNAATRLESFVVTWGENAEGGTPMIACTCLGGGRRDVRESRPR